MCTTSASRSEANPDPHCYGCFLVLREMVPRGHRLHLPLADEVQGQAGHKHADAERGRDGEAAQHDQHSLAVSLGMEWEGQGGPHPGLVLTPSWKVTDLSLQAGPPLGAPDLSALLPSVNPFLTVPSAPRGQCPQHCACFPTCSCSLAVPSLSKGPSTCQGPGPETQAEADGLDSSLCCHEPCNPSSSPIHSLPKSFQSVHFSPLPRHRRGPSHLPFLTGCVQRLLYISPHLEFEPSIQSILHSATRNTFSKTQICFNLSIAPYCPWK